MPDRRAADTYTAGNFPAVYQGMAWPYMPRPQFLERVGDPEESSRRAAALSAEAAKTWDTLRPLLFTKAGKERAAVSPAVAQQREQHSRVRGEIRRLQDYAYQQAKSTLGGRGRLK